MPLRRCDGRGLVTLGYFAQNGRRGAVRVSGSAGHRPKDPLVTQTQQPGWTYPMPAATPPGHASSRTSWYRRHWVQLIAVGVVALALGAGTAGAGTSSANKRLAATQHHLTATDQQLAAARVAATDAETRAAHAKQAAEAAVAPKVAAGVRAERAAITKERTRLAGVQAALTADRTALASQKADLDTREAKISGAESQAAADTDQQWHLTEVRIGVAYDGGWDANVRVRNEADVSRSANVTVSIQKNGTEVGSVSCPLDTVAPGQTVSAGCVGSSGDAYVSGPWQYQFQVDTSYDAG